MTAFIPRMTACPRLMTAFIPRMTACPRLMTASVALMTASMFEMGVPIVRLSPLEIGIRASLAFMRSRLCEMDPRVHLAVALTHCTGALTRGRGAPIGVTDTLVRDVV
jgi:hypothetical protein